MNAAGSSGVSSKTRLGSCGVVTWEGSRPCYRELPLSAACVLLVTIPHRMNETAQHEPGPPGGPVLSSQSRPRPRRNTRLGAQRPRPVPASKGSESQWIMAGDWPWIFNFDQWGREPVATNGERLACYRLGALGGERLDTNAGRAGNRRCFRTDNVRHIHRVSRCGVCAGQRPSPASSIVDGRWQMPIRNAYPNPNNDMGVAQR
jgi:hypothetical protein